MILKLVSQGYYGANLVQLDAANTNRLAQQDLQVPEQTSNRAVPSLFKPTIPIQTRRNSSRPDAMLVTPHPTNLNRPPTPPSHGVLHSMGSSTTPARHIHLIEIKYCEVTRPSAQLEASQQQHSELCKQLQGRAVTLDTNFLGVGRACYTVKQHTPKQSRQLGLDLQWAPTLHNGPESLVFY
eukprot:1161822-Pelagomonas_calceolata.AAC.2